jgi:FkbM family methyltransferase
MEDLWFNAEASFTKWVIADGLLREPFVVVDIGVQGGANVRWNLLGDYLILHGFDAIEEVISELKKSNAGRQSQKFYSYAIGDTDGERTFFVNAANPTNSTMYGLLAEQARTVAVRRLDTLFSDGVIPQADFLKVDVEGFEKEVFLGAHTFISAGVLGVETETNFCISPHYPKSHFTAISDILVEHGFTFFDLGFNRIPRASFTRALQQRKVEDIAHYDLGRPATFNVLFCHDLLDERDSPQNYLKPPRPPSIDQMIKLMIIYELYGLNDIALDTADCFRDDLGSRLDVDRAVGLLANVGCRPLLAPFQSNRVERQLQAVHGIVQQLQTMQRSTSWRITAPLRATKNFLTGRWS